MANPLPFGQRVVCGSCDFRGPIKVYTDFSSGRAIRRDDIRSLHPEIAMFLTNRLSEHKARHVSTVRASSDDQVTIEAHLRSIHIEEVHNISELEAETFEYFKDDGRRQNERCERDFFVRELEAFDQNHPQSPELE